MTNQSFLTEKTMGWLHAKWLRLWEVLLGLDKGFLRRDGERHWHFNPKWPGQEWLDHLFNRPGFGATLWNGLLIAAIAVLVWYVYRREGHSRRPRLILGTMRAALLLFVLALLNHPVLTLVETVKEPSVLAILIDDSVSMQVEDAGNALPEASDAERQRQTQETLRGATWPAAKSRIGVAVELWMRDNAGLIEELAKTHVLKFYHFEASAAGQTRAGGRAAQPIATVDLVSDDKKRNEEESKQHLRGALADAAVALEKLKAEGNTTQVVASVRSVLEDLQGQLVAGVVVLTDGRDTPAENLAEQVAAVANFGVKVYPIAVGSDRTPQNIEVRSINVQDSAFKGDIVNVKAKVFASGYERGHAVRLWLSDSRTKLPLMNSRGDPAEQTIFIEGPEPRDVELQFKADQIGMLDVTVQAVPQPGEISNKDNQRVAAMEVLDAKINVLYVDGYPRWEYRYFKNEMIREPTVNVSCILTSADVGFAQEGTPKDRLREFKYFPFKFFPETLEQIQDCDVVIFGDVEPRYFTDSQLALVKRFVEEYGGGFGMVAGPKFAPAAFKNTAIQDLLPVTIGKVQPAEELGSITQGFRPVVTKEGEDSSVFRFFPDRAENDLYLKERIQPIFWYCKGVAAKPGLGEVYAEHPNDTVDGRKAPILVVGHFGAGRTLFSAIDDSWRWRYYTGESIFDTYWIQQLRYLARGKKLGSRGMTFTSLRDAYEVGEQVKLSLHVLNRRLLQELPQQLGVDIVNGQGEVVRHEMLVRQEGQVDTYIAEFTADQIGSFTAKLPPVTGDAREQNVRLEVNVPALELTQPQVDRTLLSRLASETKAVLPGSAEPRLIELATARQDLPKIASVARISPAPTDARLWDKPFALVFFVLLLTVEWVLRKVYGML